MSPFGRSFKCTVYTPAGCVLSCEALSVVYPASDGMMGVLASRSPVVTMLGAGVMTVKTADGKTLEYFVAGGFASTNENDFMLLADECEQMDSLDRDQAWQAIERIRRLPAETEDAYTRKTELLEVARKKFNLIQIYAQKKKQQTRERLEEKMKKLNEK